MWCTMIELSRSGNKAYDPMDGRKKHVPGLVEIHEQLLQLLKDNLKELQPPFGTPKHVVNIDESVDDAQPDSASLCCMPRSSIRSKVAGTISDPASSASEKRNAQLRKHIEDTIRRLHGHALIINYVLYPHKVPCDIENFIIGNAKGVFTLARLLVNWSADPGAQRFFVTPYSQTLLSWARERAHKAAVAPLLHKPSPVLPRFLSLEEYDINVKFRQLSMAERELELLWAKYKSPNEKMDRYGNISPWARNRVKLQVPENKPDYINTSPITLTSSSPNQPPLHYIAMQGPTEPSFNHVWRGCEQNCAQYLPMYGENATWTFNDDNIWGDNWKAHLTFNSREVIAGGAIEKSMLVLRVYKEGGEKETRVIWHFLYKRWPDFGVPTRNDLDSLLQLIKLSEQHSSPLIKRIVHCSAGVGRTGSFIALDHLIRELNLGVLERFDEPSEGPDLICNTVDILHQQRCSMVQSKKQYRFIYQFMRKLWCDKYGVIDEDADDFE
ncbi:protein-tyrosine phosphatase domain-containing protein [Trichoderma breve]|uniref:Protein-tyrosine phosphatase domain-containing protein n=1 Tax=Trichoderma breve TaxID=2034170 RepID=A0A9W9BC29_9HYPO|nr:protein-tyrosine phosphatase domain-containing protein [Trichoderma breve]KAJ4859709.1 protein-tyrosine phosphatase domain-containing protein [Trichoderma breve]